MGFLNILVYMTLNAEQRYKRSKKGLSNKLYQSQKRASKYRGHKPPDYTLEEFREWLYDQDLFHELHKKWINGGCKRNNVPSCHRLDHRQSYFLEGLELLPWYKHLKKNEGVEVISLNLNSGKSMWYKSVRDARRDTGKKLSSYKKRFNKDGIIFESPFCFTTEEVLKSKGFDTIQEYLVSRQGMSL